MRPRRRCHPHRRRPHCRRLPPPPPPPPTGAQPEAREASLLRRPADPRRPHAARLAAADDDGRRPAAQGAGALPHARLWRGRGDVEPLPRLGGGAAARQREPGQGRRGGLRRRVGAEQRGAPLLRGCARRRGDPRVVDRDLRRVAARGGAVRRRGVGLRREGAARHRGPLPDGHHQRALAPERQVAPGPRRGRRRAGGAARLPVSQSGAAAMPRHPARCALRYPTSSSGTP